MNYDHKVIVLILYCYKICIYLIILLFLITEIGLSEDAFSFDIQYTAISVF